jgi:hypothetical protein
MNDTNKDQVKAKAEESKARAEEKAEDIKEQAGSQADAMLDDSEKRADAMREDMAGNLDSGAEKMHGRADMAKDIGKQAGEQVAAAGHKVASGMESTAQYMQQHSSRDIAKTATKYAQEHPMKTGLGALLTLFVFWRLMK